MSHVQGHRPGHGLTPLPDSHPQASPPIVIPWLDFRTQVMQIKNFTDPVPACAGMTRIFYFSLFLPTIVIPWLDFRTQVMQIELRHTRNGGYLLPRRDK